jgi:hypothetical protein
MIGLAMPARPRRRLAAASRSSWSQRLMGIVG